MVLSMIYWSTTNAPDGGSWDSTNSWQGGVVPGPTDTAVIEGLQGSGDVLLESNAADSISGLTTDSTCNLEVTNGSLSLGIGSNASIGGSIAVFSAETLNIGEGSSVTFGGPATIEAGGTLNVGEGTGVAIGANQTLRDAGAMTFLSGDSVTFLYGYADTTALTVSGMLNAGEDNFSAASLGSNTTYINVLANGELKAGDSTFNLSDVSYQSGSIFNSGDLSGDTFNETLYVPYTDVENLGGNASFDGMYIEPATLPSGATLSLDQIGSGSSLTYVFYSGFSVSSGATLDVAANLPVTIGAGQTLSDAGTMTFGSGDTVTFLYGYADTTALTVSGTLNASDDNFSAASLGSNTTYINVLANGEMKASDSTFNLSDVSYQSGSIFNSGDLSGDTFNETLYVPYTDVANLGGNASFDGMYIEPATLPAVRR